MRIQRQGHINLYMCTVSIQSKHLPRRLIGKQPISPPTSIMTWMPSDTLTIRVMSTMYVISPVAWTNCLIFCTLVAAESALIPFPPLNLVRTDMEVQT